MVGNSGQCLQAFVIILKGVYMKNKKTLFFISCVLIAAVAAPVLYAEEQEDRVFPVFLTGLVRKHEALKTLAMPDVEIHNVEGYENDALYLLTFIKPDDVQETQR